MNLCARITLSKLFFLSQFYYLVFVCLFSFIFMLFYEMSLNMNKNESWYFVEVLLAVVTFCLFSNLFSSMCQRWWFIVWRSHCGTSVEHGNWPHLWICVSDCPTQTIQWKVWRHKNCCIWNVLSNRVCQNKGKQLNDENEMKKKYAIFIYTRHQRWKALKNQAPLLTVTHPISTCLFMFNARVCVSLNVRFFTTFSQFI